MKRLILSICAFLCIASSVLLPLRVAPAFGETTAKEDLQKTLLDVGTNGGYGTDAGHGIYQILGMILKILFGVLGVIFLAFLLYAGFLWMTDQGGGEQVKKAKDIIRETIIGLIVLVTSYTITTFVINRLQQAAGVVSN